MTMWDHGSMRRVSLTAARALPPNGASPVDIYKGGLKPACSWQMAAVVPADSIRLTPAATAASQSSISRLCTPGRY